MIVSARPTFNVAMPPGLESGGSSGRPSRTGASASSEATVRFSYPFESGQLWTEDVTDIQDGIRQIARDRNVAFDLEVIEGSGSRSDAYTFEGQLTGNLDAVNGAERAVTSFMTRFG